MEVKRIPVRSNFVLELDEDELFTLFAGVASLSGPELEHIRGRYTTVSISDRHRALLFKKLQEQFPPKIRY